MSRIASMFGGFGAAYNFDLLDGGHRVLVVARHWPTTARALLVGILRQPTQFVFEKCWSDRPLTDFLAALFAFAGETFKAGWV
ncbi:hypothetical protein NHH03_15160 [Stieleria sp. TO1_6]|uniref:hypothetical protein n=1 Tax=Stieleria tagensis TaxID=2956795 RepID=UPI00209BB9FB|nr:hypothetical protein [Stieleria tagensis]MCO8123085.1 hypothetical protein [Stieleria tagensis]